MSEDVKAAHRELAETVMGRKGVAGTAIGREAGRPCLKVYVSDSEAGRTLPKTFRGFTVVVEKTGRFERL